MDVFGPLWEDHVGRLEAAWNQQVEPADTVLIAGDTDWALHLDDALETLWRINSWKGTKILTRGNHDYWWSSKTTNKVRQALPPTISLLHNSAFQVEGFNICGAKGSSVPGGIDWTEENAKLLNRELQRLQLSLKARDPRLPTIVALHYPPFYLAQAESPYKEVLEAHDVSACVYGHLHGDATVSGPQGQFGMVKYKLVSADALQFRPALIAQGGTLAA
jgi:uncharacterized protein